MRKFASNGYCRRDGESTYHINNIHVRRRDIADIFLGTGIGGRGYAIIEQGMISRIIEAKPEELRVFLEEAAGISKYRERRRETELRLADTRENLLRVSDICHELEKQLVRLEEQAKVASPLSRYTDSSCTRRKIFCGGPANRKRGAAYARRKGVPVTANGPGSRNRAPARYRKMPGGKTGFSIMPPATVCIRRKASFMRSTLKWRMSNSRFGTCAKTASVWRSKLQQ